MEGFLDINMVSNLTAYSVAEIELLVSNRQIPHNSWADGTVLFPARDIETWLKTHKKAPASTAPAKAATSWIEEPAVATSATEEAKPRPVAKVPKVDKGIKAPKGQKK